MLHTPRLRYWYDRLASSAFLQTFRRACPPFSQCVYRVDNWIRSPWSVDCYDVTHVSTTMMGMIDAALTFSGDFNMITR